MTMPQTAVAVEALGMRRPSELSSSELIMLRHCLNNDLPGVMQVIDEAASKEVEGMYTYLSKSPADVGGKNEWSMLVSYLARLFASPFAEIVHEYVRRRYSVSVAFVNCCIIAVWPGEVDEDELWCLQARMQRTPDC